MEKLIEAVKNGGFTVYDLDRDACRRMGLIHPIQVILTDMESTVAGDVWSRVGERLGGCLCVSDSTPRYELDREVIEDFMSVALNAGH